ncbi:MAG: V-type ATP synthase subunit D [Synergistales bacterium]|nr:V-type ATP synthase subunit D [Synergistales bacterium]
MSAPPTREQLLALKQQMETISGGMSLLEKKRDALLQALEKDRRAFRELSRRFQEACERIAFPFTLVRLFEGEATLTLIRSSSRPLRLSSSRHSLMGCSYPQFARTQQPSDQEELLLADPALSSLHMDDLLSELSAADTLLWDYINMKVRIDALERELAKTMRKLNNLEYVIYPSLQSEYKRIRDILQERERQERFTLKKFKRKRAGQQTG